MESTIRSVAVIGAGTMGAAIAAHVANAGLPVLLLDIPPRELTDAEAAKGLTLDHPKVRNRIVRQGFDRCRKLKPASFMSRRAVERVSLGNTEDDFEGSAVFVDRKRVGAQSSEIGRESDQAAGVERVAVGPETRDREDRRFPVRRDPSRVRGEGQHATRGSDGVRGTVTAGRIESQGGSGQGQEEKGISVHLCFRRGVVCSLSLAVYGAAPESVYRPENKAASSHRRARRIRSFEPDGCVRQGTGTVTSTVTSSVPALLVAVRVTM